MLVQSSPILSSISFQSLSSLPKTAFARFTETFKALGQMLSNAVSSLHSRVQPVKAEPVATTEDKAPVTSTLQKVKNFVTAHKRPILIGFATASAVIGLGIIGQLIANAPAVVKNIPNGGPISYPSFTRKDFAAQKLQALAIAAKEAGICKPNYQTITWTGPGFLEPLKLTCVDSTTSFGTSFLNKVPSWIPLNKILQNSTLACAPHPELVDVLNETKLAGV